MIKINLLPGKTKKDLIKTDLFLFFFFVIISFLALSGIYYFNEKEIKDYNSKIEDIKKEIASYQQIYKEYLALEQEKKETQRRINAIESIKEGRALSARILYDLSLVIKDNVWLKSFKKTDNKFELDGRSLENESISSLVETLSNIPYIKNVELRNVEETAEDGVVVKRFVILGDISL